VEPPPQPIFKSSKLSPKNRGSRSWGNPHRCRFVIALEVDEPRDPVDAWRLVRRCEDLLRERAPAGVEISPVEFRVSRAQGKDGTENGRKWAAGVRKAAQDEQAAIAEGAKRQAEAARQLAVELPSRVHAPPRFDEEESREIGRPYRRRSESALKQAAAFAGEGDIEVVN
jgi:hypothetical protein